MAGSDPPDFINLLNCTKTVQENQGFGWHIIKDMAWAGLGGCRKNVIEW